MSKETGFLEGLGPFLKELPCTLQTFHPLAMVLLPCKQTTQRQTIYLRDSPRTTTSTTTTRLLTLSGQYSTFSSSLLRRCRRSFYFLLVEELHPIEYQFHAVVFSLHQAIWFSVFLVGYWLAKDKKSIISRLVI